MWFSYLLLFFHKVLNFSNSMAGYVMLTGQIADGIATPLVGYESDRRGNLCNYGRRKTWHLIGTISVALSFPPLFMRCIGCTDGTSEYAQFVYYAPLVIIFQCGWAATQINHLALLPELARDSAEKVNLNALRYGFTVLSNIFVYCVTWIVFDVSASGTDQLGPEDISEFRNIVLVIVGVGCLFSLTFHLGVKECDIKQRFNTSASSVDSESSQSSLVECANENADYDEKTPLVRRESDFYSVPMMRWTDWFKRPEFYQMALLYMCTRLVVNMSQVYIPMYLTDTLNLSKHYIAMVPLVVYVCGFFGAVLTKPISKFLRNEAIYLIGAFLVLVSCTWAHFLDADAEETKRYVFGLAAILGVGTTIILVMCLSMLSEMVGRNTETGAFVYGAMSLTDKISNGIAIAIIQNLNPCICNCPRCGQFFRIVMGWVIDAIMLVAIVALCLFAFSMRRKEMREGCETSVVKADDALCDDLASDGINA